MHPDAGRIASCASMPETSASNRGQDGAFSACVAYRDRSRERQLLENVRRAAGHREPGTTKVYDHRGYNPEKPREPFHDVLSTFVAIETGFNTIHSAHWPEVRS
jgi:hypothetical protein